MSDVYKSTTFKSGNSVALRLPKALGVPEGIEVSMVREAPMTFRVQPVDAPKRKIDVSGFAGKAPGIRLAPREDFEERPSTIAARENAVAATEAWIRYLIDANSAVYAMDVGNEPLKARIAACDAGDMAISVISFAEIAYGTHVGKPPPPEVLEAFIAVIPLLPFDEAAARAYAQLPFKPARFDRLLAAHALSIGAVVITNNEADFADVPELKVENWTL